MRYRNELIELDSTPASTNTGSGCSGAWLVRCAVSTTRAPQWRGERRGATGRSVNFEIKADEGFGRSLEELDVAAAGGTTAVAINRRRTGFALTISAAIFLALVRGAGATGIPAFVCVVGHSFNSPSKGGWVVRRHSNSQPSGVHLKNVPLFRPSGCACFSGVFKYLETRNDLRAGAERGGDAAILRLGKFDGLRH